MKTTAELENIYEELNEFYFNIKAEIVVNEIVENSSISEKEFVIKNNGTFYRPFRRDIVTIDNITYLDKILLNLSRNGLYDYLPEGFFHQSHSKNPDDSPAKHRQKQQQEETDARKFFSPLENEFFHQRISIEKNECKALEDLNNLSDGFLNKFWNLENEFPDKYLEKLTRILPYCHKIAGDFELTKIVLEKLIGETVSIKKSFTTTLTPTPKKNSSDFRLGIDTILSSTQTSIQSPILHITFGPIEEEKINFYNQKDGIRKFIFKLYDYFIPFEYIIKTKFVVAKKDFFNLGVENSSIIGVSTQI